jgi:hypothetical protein
MNFSLGTQIGMVIGLLGAAVGAAVAVDEAGLFGGIFVGVMLAVVVGAFWLALAPQARRNRLLRTGRDAQATVLTIEETGVTALGDGGVARLRLLVDPAAGGEPYEVTVSTLIDRHEIPAYQPGARITVVVDPRDPATVEVV